MEASTNSNSYNVDNESVTPSTEEAVIYKEAKLVRQLSEWGMRTLQAGFLRLKDRMTCKERGEISIILQLITRLNNIRANLVGIAQIEYVFMPNLARDLNEYLATL